MQKCPFEAQNARGNVPLLGLGPHFLDASYVPGQDQLSTLSECTHVSHRVKSRHGNSTIMDNSFRGKCSSSLFMFLKNPYGQFLR